MFELKPLSREGVAAALEKAMRYRLLNEPGEAESICHDVLRIDPENQQALVILLLALTDRFGKGYAVGVVQTQEVLPRLRDAYERAYYAGIVCERRAKAHLNQGTPGSGFDAYEFLREAMDWYEKAEAMRLLSGMLEMPPRLATMMPSVPSKTQSPFSSAANSL